MGGFSPAEPLLAPVWGLLADTGTPVVVHAGHAPAGNSHTGPAPFGRLLREHPSLTAVVAHLGAPDYEDFLRLAARHDNVAGKVLLGSDFPNIPYPYARQLAGLAGLGLGDRWLKTVCWDAPVRLLG